MGCLENESAEVKKWPGGGYPPGHFLQLRRQRGNLLLPLCLKLRLLMFRLTQPIFFQQRLQHNQPFQQIVMCLWFILLCGPNRHGTDPVAVTQSGKHRVGIMPFAELTIFNQPEAVTALAD
ncbi:hypothetical protein D3C76_1056440 [compost metagenome]